MLLDTNPAHPQFVAHDMLPNGYKVKTILLLNGYSFETTVWTEDFARLVSCHHVNRNQALNTHQKMVDKYTFLHWTE